MTSFWQDRIAGSGAVPRRLSGKTPLLLDDPGLVWAVLEGRVEVYSVRIRDGVPAGARRHHFTAFAGDLLPGLGTGDAGLVLLAAGLPGTRVAALPARLLLEPRGDSAEVTEVSRLVDQFLSALCCGLTRDVAPKPSIRQEFTCGQEIVIEGTTTVRPARGIWWLRPVSPARAAPSMRFLGLEDVVLSGSEPVGPLTPETWIETWGSAGTGAIQAVDTASVLARGELPGAFDRFAELYFRCLAMELRLADVDVYGAMYTKDRAAGLARAAGIARLDTVLRVDRRVVGPEDPGPLALACVVVARATGIRIPDVPLTLQERAVDIADAWGVKQRPVTLRDDWWKRDGGPLLGFLRRDSGAGEHSCPVALLQPRPGRYVAFDPSTGKKTPIDRQNSGSVLPSAVSFYRPLPVTPLGFMDLVRYTAFGAGRDFSRIVVCGLALAFLAVIPPVAVKAIFSDAIPTADRSLVAQVVTILAVVALSVFSIGLTRVAAMQRMVGRMDFHLEPALWERLIRLPAGFHRKKGPGELADRIDGIGAVRIRLGDAFLTAFLSAIFGSVNVVLLFVYGGRLAFPALGVLLLGALAGAVINIRQGESWRQYHELHGRVTNLVVQFFSGISKIRMSGSEDQIFGLWARLFARMERLDYRAGGEQIRLLVFNQAFPIAAMIVLFAFAAGPPGPMMNTGSFLAFLAAYTALQTALLAVTTAAVKLAAILPAYRRLTPILEAVPEVNNSKVDPGRLQGRIELAQVQFRYDPDGPVILDGIDLSIAPGEFVALVGPSGSGKSTLLRLLLGFETPGAGTIRYDNRNLADLNLEKLRRNSLGVVLQDSGLLPGTVLSNIIGTRELTEADAWAAARDAGLEEDIRRLPAGMQTPVGAGNSIFSAGQRQRLAIARALAGRPSVLLLDEATSALDNRTQEIVTRALDELRVTRVVVAHRLSTVRNADRIVVLEGGRIVESGSYPDLMRRKGRFHGLVSRQLLQAEQEEPVT